MKSSQGFSVVVTVSGQVRPEYNVTTKNGNRYECYIESKADEEFSVVVTRDSSMHAISCPIFIDGIRGKNALLRSTVVSGICKGPDLPGGLMQAYKWAKINLSEANASTVRDENIIKSLGTIQIPIRRVNILQQTSPGPLTIPAVAAGRVFDEKTKKAQLDNVTGLSAPRAAVTSTFWSTVDIDQDPYITFVFQYRTKDFLELQGIKLKDVAKDAETPFTPESDEEENADDLREQMKRIKKENAELRQEVNKKRVREEVAVGKRKKLKVDKDGVIDLTDD